MHIAELVTLIDTGAITGKIAKSIADEMVASPQKSPTVIIEQNPAYKPVSDTKTIEPIVEEVLQANMQSAHDFLAGKDRAFAFLVGQVMKQTKGAASPQLVNDLLKEKIEKLKK